MALRFPMQAIVDGKSVMLLLTFEQVEEARRRLRKIKIQRYLTRGRPTRRKRGHTW